VSADKADAQVEAVADGVPPPSASLRAALATMKPVRTRKPLLAAAIILFAAALRPVYSLCVDGLRSDFGTLPTLWRTGAALVWAAGLLFVLIAATVPRRRAVLPDVASAGRAAWLAAAGLVAFGLFATVDGAETTVPPPAAFAHFWFHCIGYSVLVMLPALLAAGFLMKGLFPVGARRVAAALGAASGAAAGLALHFICSVGGGLQVGLAHAGAVVLGAALGTVHIGRVLRA
jgi:hypothetical protein